MATTVDMLRDARMFSLLDEQELATLSALLESRQFKKGEIIFNRGDVGDCLYIIRQGVVEVYVETTEGEKIVFAENTAGDVFGEISLLDGGPRTATALAIEDTDTLSCDRENLLEFITKHPHAALDVMTAMGKNLRTTDELLRSQVSRNLNAEEEEHLTLGQHVADRVAAFGGSWPFIILFGLFMAFWMGTNVYFAARAFDPFPFILLNLALSALAALQAPVIMMSQNRQAAKDRLRADLDYEVNLKAELEVAHLHNKVDRIYETMAERLAKLERSAPR
jgi:CRP/FNR family transcriptional regulator, cyclic AMP receptor protein